MNARTTVLLAALGVCAGCANGPPLFPVRVQLVGLDDAPNDALTVGVPTYEAVFTRLGDAGTPPADGGYDLSFERRRVVGSTQQFTSPLPHTAEFTAYLPAETYGRARVAVHMSFFCNGSASPTDVVVLSAEALLPMGFTPGANSDNGLVVPVTASNAAPCASP